LSGFPNVLTGFALEAWLVARFAPRLRAGLDGRTWERTVAVLLHRPGLARRQGPGSLSLFGGPSLSGARHEIDGAASSRQGSAIVECKATGGGITKGDAAIFHFKVMDFYKRSIVSASRECWWPFMCGTLPTAWSARAAAFSLGLLVCDPGRLPLPVLLRAAGQPCADMHLPEKLLQELVRLGEQVLRPLQERWRYRPASSELVFEPHRWTESGIEELLWLEDELSGLLLQLFDKCRPGMLEAMAEKLIWQVEKAA
jgi:hypothetical protein